MADHAAAAARFCDQARECRRLAEGARDSFVQNYLLAIAEQLEEEATEMEAKPEDA